LSPTAIARLVHLVFCICSASVPAREVYNNRERGRSHCKKNPFCDAGDDPLRVEHYLNCEYHLPPALPNFAINAKSKKTDFLLRKPSLGDRA